MPLNLLVFTIALGGLFAYAAVLFITWTKRNGGEYCDSQPVVLPTSFPMRVP